MYSLLKCSKTSRAPWVSLGCSPPPRPLDRHPHPLRLPTSVGTVAFVNFPVLPCSFSCSASYISSYVSSPPLLLIYRLPCEVIAEAMKKRNTSPNLGKQTQPNIYKQDRTQRSPNQTNPNLHDTRKPNP